MGFVGKFQKTKGQPLEPQGTLLVSTPMDSNIDRVIGTDGEVEKMSGERA